MKRRTVFIISLVTVALFGGLVYYGWTYRWGAPSKAVIQEAPVLAMPRREAELALEPSDFRSPLWNEMPALGVELMPQITDPPRADNRISRLEVRAFHNGREAYFLLQWPDPAESREHRSGVFPDAAAASFALAADPPRQSIMMGFQSPMNMWHWKADLDAAFWQDSAAERESPNERYSYADQAAIPLVTGGVDGACQELLAARAGSVTARETTQVSGRGQWADGRWRLIMKRPLTTENAENAIQFTRQRIYMAFAAWDGDKGNRGGRKSISNWVVLQMGAAPTQTASAAEPLGEQPRLINVSARRFEYEPSKIELQKGELVTLRLQSEDVTHGLYLDGYGIDLLARPGRIDRATFRAKKAGRFAFRCSETCGEFHPYMIGFLTVTPNSRFHLYAAAVIGIFALIAGGVYLAHGRRTGGGPAND